MRAAVLTLVLLLAGCSDDARAPATPVVPEGSVAARLGDVDLVLEVADDAQERATGLMGREQVPPGTGMVFLFEEQVEARFYMFNVPIPLKAVFVRDGQVVSSVVMPPCEESEPQACPTYGAAGPFDTVVETDPKTLPAVETGDRFVLDG
jgi:uncharacterized membrane protein (UPF0127 family)